MKILVTGGAGFIGSALIRQLIKNTDYQVLNVDKLTYAGNLDSLKLIEDNPRYSFICVDISDQHKIYSIIDQYRPNIIMHLAAESHVDRSIDGPSEFIQTNILGTFNLLEASRKYWSGLDSLDREKFIFHHISTDEVFGDLPHPDDVDAANATDLFTESSAYAPSSPYSASKAASDHLVNAWMRTYNLPAVITNCSNNYGPFHFPEKLIPLTILNALEGKNIPVYGSGQQIRDWLFVDDHAEALILVATKSKSGDSFNIGGNNEKRNIEVVETICKILDELRPAADSGLDIQNYAELIQFVDDRPGHDARYAIDSTKIQNELGWQPRDTFESGIKKTIDWYLENLDWCNRVQDGSYMRERLGLNQ